MRLGQGGGSVSDMRLIFLYGPVASGKLTVARLLAEQTGFALFHNHLIVDAVASVFPFGSDAFVRLRERFWLETFQASAEEGRSLIFTFAPEPTVAPDFPDKVSDIVQAAGGEILFVGLSVAADIQEQRLTAPDRAAFGKLRSVAMLREMRADLDACLRAMPAAAVAIDTGITLPGNAVARIVRALSA